MTLHPSSVPPHTQLAEKTEKRRKLMQEAREIEEDLQRREQLRQLQEQVPLEGCAVLGCKSVHTIRALLFFLCMQTPGTLHPLFSVRMKLSRLMVLSY
jgi:hypothetical protein